MDNRIDREKLRQALEQVRRDIANLQRNRSIDSADLIKLVAFTLYLVLAEFLQSVLGINILWCFLISVVAVTIYALVLVSRHVRRPFGEPVEPTWDTKVEL